MTLLRASTTWASALTITLALAACDKGASTGGAGSAGSATPPSAGSGAPKDPGASAPDIDSKDVLARTEVASTANVRHVLIGWKDLAAAYRGQMDPRAAGRTAAEAAALAQPGRRRAARRRRRPRRPDQGALRGSRLAHRRALRRRRRRAHGAGVPRAGAAAQGRRGRHRPSQFGYHVMMRVPLDRSSRPTCWRARPGPAATIQHVLIGWKDVPAAKQRPLDPRAANRTKAEADALAQQILGELRGGAEMTALMKKYSEDEGSKDNGRTMDIAPASQTVAPLKFLALRLGDGEAGLARTPFGWHVVLRLPPPPPDPIESADVLARAPATAKAKVKHILLGWKDVNSGDPRGANRSRADLEALVTKTMASLRGGAAIEPLMKELSEDGGSAQSGTSYDVTPTAGLVPPFKDLSLRLAVGEVGAVKTQFGIHIIQRTE
ncbi:MAG: peptidylprolyl isomerase [Kofleriaceae bacterium]